ncbi:MAG: ParB/RepB/Spo0J family partition protein [Proteobacteria bacterium]|nr:ParB/RepB/Spo0J family partition protein [Pseudomonadota bacterium]MBU4470345.1 ParB/RepB/Spo0J family partition protein [Pseudomonadota bacterium]MCG2752756.1 ParB/RepB/Spo0J family partition protein [Desulfobacteraceae bacterium]
MKFRLEMINPGDIDSTDLSFQITTREDTDDLVASIRAIGVINPPLLWQEDHGRRVIVCGRRRIAACFKAGMASVECRIAEEANRLECVKTAISDNAFQRQLNWVEISRALNRLMQEIRDKDQVLSMLPDLGLPEGKDILDKAIRIAHFTQPIQDGLISGQIPFAMALELGGLEPETGSFLANLFQQLTLSLNKQREILEWAVEIAARESKTPMDILLENGIQEVIKNPDWDRNQKGTALRKHLRTRRYPSIQKAEALFQEGMKSLKIPPGIRLSPPKDFESDRYAFQIEFKKQSQLASRLKILERLSEAQALKDLLDGLDLDSPPAHASSSFRSKAVK